MKSLGWKGWCPRGAPLGSEEALKPSNEKKKGEEKGEEEEKVGFEKKKGGRKKRGMGENG